MTEQKKKKPYIPILLNAAMIALAAYGIAGNRYAFNLYAFCAFAFLALDILICVTKSVALPKHQKLFDELSQQKLVPIANKISDTIITIMMAATGHFVLATCQFIRLGSAIYYYSSEEKEHVE